MSVSSLHPHPEAVKHGRFVAPTLEAQSEVEFRNGQRMYRRGQHRSECVTDDMDAGWLSCQEHGEKFGWMRSPAARGEDAYWLGMMAQASTEAM